MASKGLNIVLISRTQSKLVEVANEIGKFKIKIILNICLLKTFLYFTESKYPVKTKWIAADFSQGISVYDHIKNELSGIPVGILGKYNKL